MTERSDSTVSPGALDAADEPRTVEWELRGVGSRVWSRAELARVPGPVITLVVGAACLALGLSVVWRGNASDTAAGFWPPAGAGLAALLVLPKHRWRWVLPGIAMPTVVGLALGMMPLVPALWWLAGNTVEPLVAALILTTVSPARWHTPGRQTVLFLAVAVGLGPVVGAALGAVGTAAGYGRPWHQAWSEWAVGDGLGVLAVAPLLVTYVTTPLVRRARGELAGLVALVAVAIGLAFVDIGANGAALLPYLILVALIWAGMRFGTRAAAVSGFVVGIGGNVAAASDLGPFAPGNGAVSIVTLQVFLAIALITSFVIAAMASELADRDEVQVLLQRQATHDALTGLPNRLLFADRLERALQSRGRTGTAVAVVLLDLDDFKRINDRHGHPAGDEVLSVVAALLRSQVPPADLVARIGGDEFVVVCEDLHDVDEAKAVAEAMLRALDQCLEVADRQYRLTGSIGVAFALPVDQITSTDLLRRAAVALHHSKQDQRARITLFDHALEARTRRRAELHEELRGAIDRGEMFVEYQPIVRLPSGQVARFEALVRWTNRRFGRVSPDEFVTVAEDTGLIGSIGDWVLQRACLQVAAWRREHGGGERSAATVAVNVSARQLADPHFPARVRELLQQSQLEPNGLVLEITETAVMVDFDTSTRMLAELREVGVKLSMDDFGTGYSSLTYLRRIRVDTLKIDRSFVSGLGIVLEDEAIVQSIINLAHSFGIEVVAEGIETVHQLEHLVRYGCDYGQGFLWSEAIGAAAAGALLKDAADDTVRHLERVSVARRLAPT